MKSYRIDVNVGDLVDVGRFRNVQTKIKGIEIDEHGQPVIITTKGKKKLFSLTINKINTGYKDTQTDFKGETWPKKTHLVSQAEYQKYCPVRCTEYCWTTVTQCWPMPVVELRRTRSKF
jgi:hypothetical protein